MQDASIASEQHSTNTAALLAAHNITATSQRMQIASVLLSEPMHLSADQLLEKLRFGGEKVSKATVYNTLKLFVERGLIRQIHLDPERTVYDSRRVTHHHFHEVETGTLWDIDPEDVSFSRLPQLPEGMEIAGVEVIIRVAKKAQ
jgi:Fur family iron response transcriptional regulator